MNRNLPISNRISVDVQQLFEDLIVVKCNVNNKEFQGILLNTSKSFFGINESRLKSGPESLTVKELDKGNVSFSCSVERYSYKLDGTGPSIFTRHPVKRHKSPPVSGKHVICQKCQSVVSIPDQVDDRKQTGEKDESRDDLYEVSGSRTYNRRKSQSAPKRNSNFDTRENYENNHFINYKPKVEEKVNLDSSIFEIGSNITKITPSAGLLDVKKILKKKKKRDRVKDRLKESESVTKSTKLEEVKERVKKRKLENQNDRAPIKKCKLLEIPYHSNERGNAEKSGKVLKHTPETQTKEILCQSKEVPLIKETCGRTKDLTHTKDNIKISKKADTSQESASSQADITHSIKLASKKTDLAESRDICRETPEVSRVQAETLNPGQQQKLKHSLTDRCSRDDMKQIPSKQAGDARAQAKEANVIPKDSEKSSKKIKKDVLIDKKLKKKKKSDKNEVSKSEVKELLKASSVIGSINGEPITTRRAKLEAKYKTSKTSVDEVSSASSESVSGMENNQHSKEKTEVGTSKETVNLRDRRAEKSAVSALEKFMKSSYVENECYLKTRGTDEHEVTSVSADETSGNLDSSDSQTKRRGIDAPPDSSLSLKIKINRTPSSDNGGYKCRIVSDENQTVSSSTTDALQACETVSDTVFPTSATSTDQESVEVNLTGASTSSSVTAEPMETSSSITEETFVERCTLMSGNTFTVGDVVWAKITGYPWWPSRINCIRQAERIESNERIVNYTAEVLWFNWDQISFIPCEKLFHFLDHYKAKCDKKRKGTYRSAVEQAWMAANTAQLIAEGDDDSVESDSNAELRSYSFGANPSHVSSSSTSVVRNKATAEPNSTNTSDASFSAPLVSVSSTSKGKSPRDSSVLLSGHADPTATSSLESRRRESTDDDSESGLVIDTELSGHGSV